MGLPSRCKMYGVVRAYHTFINTKGEGIKKAPQGRLNKTL